MNEIKRIHLGRQAFTVSVEAHRELRAYLDAIQHEAGENGADVVEEVELRIAELLHERGITGDRVVVSKDIVFLKQHLGTPRDFREEEAHEAQATDDTGERRLFRDPEHGMVAGVAAGLAAYFRIDPVIVRIVFIALIFASGAGFIIYGLLWLLLPPAQTASERLQMQGKPVTVGTLKELVERADVAGVARRSTTVVERTVTVIARIILGSVGVALAIASAASLLAVLAVACYASVRHGAIAGADIFPVGAAEVWALALSLVSVAALLIFLLLLGVGLLSWKWRLPGRTMIALAGIFFIVAPIAGALMADRMPRIVDRVEHLRHTETRSLSPFATASFSGQDTHFIFVPDSNYAIEYHYLGAADLSKVRVQVDHGKLSVDTGKLARRQLCDTLCLYTGPDLQVYVHAPRLESVAVQGDSAVFATKSTLDQPKLDLTVAPHALLDLNYLYPDTAVLDSKPGAVQHLSLALGKGAQKDDMVHMNDDGILSISKAGMVDMRTDRTCDESEAAVLVDMVQSVKVNGQIFATANDLRDVQTSDRSTVYNCLSVN